MATKIEMPKGPTEGEERSDMGRVREVARANSLPKGGEGGAESSIKGACEYLHERDAKWGAKRDEKAEHEEKE